MKKDIEIPLRQPTYKVINGQPKWCCSSPNCPHTLATVFNTNQGVVLELPKDYGRFDDLQGFPFYGPISWMDGRREPLQGIANTPTRKFTFRPYLEMPIDTAPIRLSAEEIQVAFAVMCRSGHAFYLIGTDKVINASK